MDELKNVPVEVRTDRTLRVKIIDACGLACQFCHNEGTPVTTDNKGRAPGEFSGAPGVSGRVSIYLRTNGADFLPARIAADSDFALALAAVRGSLPTDEVHFTGGEPTLHPELPGLIGIARRLGLRVGLTSNGERGAAVLPEAAAAGLDRINLSVFGTTPEELAAVQGPRLASPKLAARKLDALARTIEAAHAHGVKVSANIVIPDHDHVERVLRVIERHGRSVVVRMLVSLEDDGASLAAMREVVDRLGAVPVRRIITAGASDQRVCYRLPDGRPLYAKSIRPVRLPETCADCRFNNPDDCQEGYYGVRMYRATEGPFMVGVCIQRMDLCVPLGDFVMSQRCGEVAAFREDEAARLARLYPAGAVSRVRVRP
ncbi:MULTISPECIES: radical SAM protein [Streptomyces]|uniref:radical SAM protein n=1 Tax=Streptomyces TaxID=1883 RepID=UPI00101E4BD3|nr:radical SAM protein [Streptomyces albidoflavus]MYX53431.1 radical SAM protein [Streptomyces sp. SID8385]RZE93479.1 radical SAM protein [Streptomyces albidoflavus]RZE95408.1 radical SAM protein [Streptomyces albidoflavus]WTC36341.1 radical SAM protein [Streptomyces albidoflavus]